MKEATEVMASTNEALTVHKIDTVKILERFRSKRSHISSYLCKTCFKIGLLKADS